MSEFTIKVRVIKTSKGPIKVLSGFDRHIPHAIMSELCTSIYKAIAPIAEEYFSVETIANDPEIPPDTAA